MFTCYNVNGKNQKMLQIVAQDSNPLSAPLTKRSPHLSKGELQAELNPTLKISFAIIWWEIQLRIPRVRTALLSSETIGGGTFVRRFTTAWASPSPISNAFWKAVAEDHSCSAL